MTPSRAVGPLLTVAIASCGVQHLYFDIDGGVGTGDDASAVASHLEAGPPDVRRPLQQDASPEPSFVSCADGGACPPNAPICSPKRSVCVACLDDQDCPGQTCDPYLAQCVQCSSDWQCPSGQSCDSNQCVEYCSHNYDCSRGTCDPVMHICISGNDGGSSRSGDGGDDSGFR
ncbi:MAG: hypothetical protein ACRENE_02905 [Polyangiaceae bacterium]